MPVEKRSSAEIRQSIETEREALSKALTSLRGEVTELTDWRKQVSKHRNELLLGAAVVGVLAMVSVLIRRLFAGD